MLGYILIGIRSLLYCCIIIVFCVVDGSMAEAQKINSNHDDRWWDADDDKTNSNCNCCSLVGPMDNWKCKQKPKNSKNSTSKIKKRKTRVYFELDWTSQSGTVQQFFIDLIKWWCNFNAYVYKMYKLRGLDTLSTVHNDQAHYYYHSFDIRFLFTLDVYLLFSFVQCIKQPLKQNWTVYTNRRLRMMQETHKIWLKNLFLNFILLWFN